MFLEARRDFIRSSLSNAFMPHLALCFSIWGVDRQVERLFLAFIERSNLFSYSFFVGIFQMTRKVITFVTGVQLWVFESEICFCENLTVNFSAHRSRGFFRVKIMRDGQVQSCW